MPRKAGYDLKTIVKSNGQRKTHVVNQFRVGPTETQVALVLTGKRDEYVSLKFSER